ncbi:MAG: hypothetical protein AAGK78_16515, partial [Planctomycetota bacterium]
MLLEDVPGVDAGALHAARMAERGEVDAARKMLEAELVAATGDVRRDWFLALARWSEQFQPDTAPRAWRMLAVEYEDDALVQHAVLAEASSLQRDTELRRDTIERLRTITGSEGRSWRLEEARLLLDEVEAATPDGAVATGDAQTKAMRAADLLRQLVRVEYDSPSSIDARLLLAESLQSLGNLSAAAGHLQEAWSLDRARGDVGLRLADVLESQGQQVEARRVLGALAAEGVSGRAARLEVAGRLAEAGDADAAVSLLRQAAQAGDLDVSGRTVLAELLARQGDEAGAERLYEPMLRGAQPPAGVLLSAAVFEGRRVEIAAS